MKTNRKTSFARRFRSNPNLIKKPKRRITAYIRICYDVWAEPILREGPRLIQANSFNLAQATNCQPYYAKFNTKART